MKKILIIEDNQDIRENLMEILELSDYEVLSADNGQNGITRIRKDRPHIILCDIAMPGLDGFQVLKAAKAHPSSAEIPFVFITSSAQSRDVAFGMKAGADAYLAKPFETRLLIHTIENFLKKKEDVSYQ